MVSIRKFQIIVLVSNQIEYCSNCSIQFEISNIRTALDATNKWPTELCNMNEPFHCWSIGKTCCLGQQTN